MSPEDPGEPASAGDLNTVWKKDVHKLGSATCPKCGALIKYGTAGVPNLVRRHLDTQTCQEKTKKQDNQPRKNASLTTWLKKTTAPIGRVLAASSDPPPPSPALPSRIIQLLDQLRAAVERLPSSVPNADESSPLAVFSGVPAEYVSQDTPVCSLWEELGGYFRKAFDYGAGLDARVRLVTRGPFGLNGTLHFLDYFIRERGLEGGPVELKLEQLIDAVNSVISTMSSRSPHPVVEEVPDEDANPESACDIIDIDADAEINAEKPEITIETPRPSKKALPCGGFVFPFSGPGKTASSDYPYALHDTLQLPWTYSSSADGTLTLRSIACSKIRAKGRSNCRACTDFSKDSILEGILDRAKHRVHEKANYAYQSFSGLIELLRRKNKRIEEMKMRGFNAARRIARQARSLTDHKRFVRVENVDRLTESTTRRATPRKTTFVVYFFGSSLEIAWDFAHQALGLPSRRTLAKRTTVPPIVPSPGKPNTAEVAENVGASFKGITEVLSAKKPKHVVLMYDEIATEKRMRWDPKTNNFLGELFNAKEENKVHFAGEATMAALGILSDEKRLYAARPILISGDCRKETGPEHLHNVVKPTIDGVNSKHVEKPSWTRLAFSRTLAPESDIYPILSDLLLMDFHVGEDDITADKDAKHIFKWGRNRLLRMLGMKVFGVQITPAIIRAHLQQAGHSTQHINSVLRPDDKQDVELAYELLKDLWNLPPAPEGSRPGFIAARDALRIIGSFFYDLIFLYICVDLTLSEQLEHLSTAAHLNLLLYRDGQKEALPMLLFTDIMIMIKNAYFCVAKAKVDDPTGNFWLILLGTDRLEELFGILRTMIGNDRNLDMLQLVERITGTTEVANIFAQYPHWDHPPRRLHLPALARDSTALPNSVDHIKPGLWRGDTSVASVSPQTCWIRGRRLIEQELPALAKYFRALDTAYNVNILSPLGELIVHKDLDVDDNEDDDEQAAAAPKSSVSPDLEDAAVDKDILDDSQAPTFSKFITVGNKPLRKTRALSLMQKYGYQAGSTDRLKRVADVQQYSAKSDEPSTLIESDSPYLLVSEPIATLVRCEEKLFVCIGEVTDMRLDSKSNDQLSLDVLQERNIAVHFHILQLIPATTEDDPDSKHDWRSTGVLRDVLISPGRLVLPVDPNLSTRVVGNPTISSKVAFFAVSVLNSSKKSRWTLTKRFQNSRRRLTSLTENLLVTHALFVKGIPR
ncbi:hypothetical protein B0H10DRAFT_2244898 [Mycena sp. CBHHK59/15]|nr:hypothetical protein B0H10DRAFT_2244898 [Mycena sp. CBHHK59/15]